MIFHKQYGTSGPVLVVLHGLFGNADNWHSIAQTWGKEFSVYCLDLPNHGRSNSLQDVTYPKMAKEVIAWADQQGLADFYLLGHSMGGKVAMQIANDYPTRVKKLVVADIAPVTYGGSHERIFAGLNAISIALPSTRKEADQILSQYEENLGVRQFLLKNLTKTDNGLTIGLDFVALENSYLNILRAPELNNGNTTQTLFIKGENSNYMLPSHSNVTLGYFPNAQVKIIPGTGHWLHAEKPQVFASLVKRFLTT